MAPTVGGAYGGRLQGQGWGSPAVKRPSLSANSAAGVRIGAAFIHVETAAATLTEFCVPNEDATQLRATATASASTPGGSGTH